MPNPFASGKWALAICDNCGRTVKYSELKRDRVAQRMTGVLVCEDCWDEDHPQLMLGRFRIEDPITLQHARPDWKPTQGLMGFDPITGGAFRISMGNVHAITDWTETAPVEQEWIVSLVGPAVLISVEVGNVYIES
jgi:hypothetical protein